MFDSDEFNSSKAVCRGSGGQSPASYHGIPDSIPGQLMWDLWCTRWHWTCFPPSTSYFSCQYQSTNVPYRLHLHVPLTRRTNGRGLGTFKSNVVSESGSRG